MIGLGFSIWTSSHWRPPLFLIESNLILRSLTFFLMLEFQWFLIALSVLPLITAVISAQWLPTALWKRYKTHSSSADHLVLLIFGFKWLCHLSRHCLPTLPGMKLDIHVHLDGPYLWTSFITFLSSSSVHGPIMD